MAIASNTTQGTIVMAGDLSATSTGSMPELRATGVTPGVYNSSIGAIAGNGTAPVTAPVLVVDTKGRVIYAKSSTTTETIPVSSTTEAGVVRPDGTTVTISNGTISSTVSTYTNATSTDLGFVKIPGDTGIVETVFGNGIAALKQSSSTALGKVRPNNSTVTVSNGVLSSVLPTATTSVFGKVRPDGTSIGVGVDGTIYTTVPSATSSSTGVVQVDNDSITISGGVITSHIAKATSSTLGTVQPDNSTIGISGGILSTILQPATASSLGFVKVDGTSITSTGGVIYAVVPTSSTSVFGKVKPDNLTINSSSGILSATFPLSADTVLGKIKPDNTSVTVSGGVISKITTAYADATSTTNGYFSVSSSYFTSASGVNSLRISDSSYFGVARGDNTSIINTSGVLSQSVLYADATSSTNGVVQVDSSISVSSGVLSLPTATSSLFGIVRGGSTFYGNSVLSAVTATSSVLGIAKGDGTTISTTNGDASRILNTASTSVLGLSRPDNSTIILTSNVLSIPPASATTFGTVKVSSGVFEVNNGVVSTNLIDLSKSNLRIGLDSYTALTVNMVGQANAPMSPSYKIDLTDGCNLVNLYNYSSTATILTVSGFLYSGVGIGTELTIVFSKNNAGSSLSFATFSGSGAYGSFSTELIGGSPISVIANAAASMTTSQKLYIDIYVGSYKDTLNSLSNQPCGIILGYSIK